MPSEYRGDSSTKQYFREIAEYPLLTRSEELDIARRIAGGDEDARDKMIVSNLRLVVKIAHEFKGFGLPIQDVIAYGNTGLMSAAEKFDAEKTIQYGTKFSSYASWWIKKEIRKALAERGPKALVMIRATKASRINMLKTKRELLRAELGREPTSEELVTATGKTRRMIKILEEAEKISFVHLDDDDRTRSFDGAPDVEFLRRENSEHLRKAMECLDEREYRIITLKFGFDGGHERTLGEVGDELGLCGERIRQIVRQATAKLRARMIEMESKLT